MNETQTLYTRLGGYDAVAAVAENLLPRLMSDAQLGRFWEHRGEDGLRREKQLLIDFLCAAAGGPVLYTGRDMLTSHSLGHENQRNRLVPFSGTLTGHSGPFCSP